MAAKNKIEVVLSMLDKATAPFVAFNKRLEAAQAPVRKLNNKIVMLGREAGVSRISAQFGKVADAAGTAARRVAEVGLAAIGAGFAFKRAFIDVAAQFEQSELILETIEGSQSKAKSAMSWISDFAAKTPYELSEVTDSFVKLRAYGLDPTNGLLKTLGDTSAAMGKPMMMAVEAIADAMTGENERLKEFGIRASKVGSRIVYEYTANGKTMRAAAQASNRAQIQATLEAIWNRKYGGAMDKLSGGWGGMMSNLSDQWTRFAKMVMDSGPFESLKNKLSTFLAKLDGMAKNGELARIAAEWGAKITEGIEKVAVAVREIYDVASGFVNAVGGIANAVKIVALVMAGPLLLSLGLVIKSVWLLGAAIGGTPVGWFLAAVIAIATVAKYIYDNWEPIKEFFASLWDGVKARFISTFAFIKDLFFRFHPLGIIMKNWGAIGDYFSSLWDGIINRFTRGATVIKSILQSLNPFSDAAAAPVPAVSHGAAIGAQAVAASAASRSVTQTNNAKVEVDFKNVPRGVQVTPQGGNSAPVDLSLGYAGMIAP